MTPHLRYLRYVLTHKLYVFLAGVAVARVNGFGFLAWCRQLWRLATHDWSKFRPSEWRPYVAKFYGSNPRSADETVRRLGSRVDNAFNLAWLLHQRRNDHHWQAWVLRNDDGRTIVCPMPDHVALEMLADWLGAGTKILRGPTLAECVGETVKWYAANAALINLRQSTRVLIEETLLALSNQYGLTAMAIEVQSQRAARASITIPGRS